MLKSILSSTIIDENIYPVFLETSKKTASLWACDCAMRVILYFTPTIPDDSPYQALKVSYNYINDNFNKNEFKNALKAIKYCCQNTINIKNKAIALSCLYAIKSIQNKKYALKTAIMVLESVSYIEDIDLKLEQKWQLEHLKELNKN